MLHINEVFIAPQGEGLFTGMPMVFVRLQGCNLRCAFCDTMGAIAREISDEAIQLRPAPVLAQQLLVEYGDNRVVCFTGGEPLLQTGEVIDVAAVLKGRGWKVHLETNGTIKLLDHQVKYFDWITVSPKGPRWTMAIPGDFVSELKFVMPPEDEYHADLDGVQWASAEAIREATEICPEAFLWLQPRSNEPEAIAWCLEMLEGLRVRWWSAPLSMGLSVQVHKYIGTK